MNQANLTPSQWQAFVDAMAALRGIGSLRPRYGTFVDVHVRAMTMGEMSWGVHSMPSMGMHEGPGARAPGPSCSGRTPGD
jgi:hypothetical protein